MDEQVIWVRNRILRAAATKAGAAWAAATAVTAAVLAVMTDLSVAAVVPWAVLTGQVVMLAWIGSALVLNPLDHRYLSAYTSTALRFKRSRTPLLEVEVAKVEGDDRLFARAAVHEDAGDVGPQRAPLFEIYQQPGAREILAVGRTAADSCVVTKLADGRLAVTVSRFVPPHRRLVVNVVPGGQAASLVRVHRRLVSELVERGAGLAATDERCLLDLLNVEQAAYRSLGPALACFVDVEYRRSPLQLVVTIPPAELLGRAMVSDPHDRSERVLVVQGVEEVAARAA